MNSEKEKAVDQLATTASLLDQNRVVPVLRHLTHDLNNAVWSILANLELIDKQTESNDEILNELLAATKIAVERASKDCQRATSVLKKTTENREPIELATAFVNAARIVDSTTSANLAIVVKDSDGSFVARTSVADVLVILWCLAENSTAAIGTEPGIIQITFSEADTDPFSIVSISDNGCGLDAAVLAECQHAFAGVDKSKLGIGLTSVAEIMYSHRGSVEVESELGVGTTFRLFFPKL